MMRTFWVICILYISAITGSSSENTNTTLPKELDGKDEFLDHCQSIEVGSEYYKQLPNGSVRLEAYNLTLDETFFVIRNGTLSICSNSASENTNTTLPKELEGKDEFLHHCQSIEVGHDYYERLPNGSVRLEGYILTLDETFYVIRNGTLSICSISTSENANITLPKELEGKDEFLDHCQSIEVDPEYYERLPNGSVRLEAYNLTLYEYFYVLRNGTPSICSISTSENTNTTLPKELEGKDESLRYCKSIKVGPAYYELLPNGSANLEKFNWTLDEPFNYLENETLFICYPFRQDVKKEHTSWTYYVILVELVMSMVGLFLHLVMFCLVPDLRNLPGWNLATLCACLFVNYFLTVVFNVNGEAVAKYETACVVMGSTRHFVLLASYVWMSILSCDFFASLLRATGRFRSSSTRFSRRKFGLYCLCSFGIALLFSILGALADALEFVPEDMRPQFEKNCWFTRRLPYLIFYGIPVIVLSALSFSLFVACVYIIHANKRKCDQDAQQPVLKRRYLMYYRLWVTMGVTWIVRIGAEAVNEDWLWTVFLVLNAVQGFCIFLAFTCCQKVKKYFRQMITGPRRSSEQTLTTSSFQSNCNYSNSVEKDLDKIVVKEKVDTITIQL